MSSETTTDPEQIFRDLEQLEAIHRHWREQSGMSGEELKEVIGSLPWLCSAARLYLRDAEAQKQERAWKGYEQFDRNYHPKRLEIAADLFKALLFIHKEDDQTESESCQQALGLTDMLITMETATRK